MWREISRTTNKYLGQQLTNDMNYLQKVQPFHMALCQQLLGLQRNPKSLAQAATRLKNSIRGKPYSKNKVSNQLSDVRP